MPHLWRGLQLGVLHDSVNHDVSLWPLGVVAAGAVIGYGHHRPAEAARHAASRSHPLGWVAALGGQADERVRLDLAVEGARRHNND